MHVRGQLELFSLTLVGKHELLHTDSCLWGNGQWLWTLHSAGEESGAAVPLYSDVTQA